MYFIHNFRLRHSIINNLHVLPYTLLLLLLMVSLCQVTSGLSGGADAHSPNYTRTILMNFQFVELTRIRILLQANVYVEICLGGARRVLMHTNAMYVRKENNPIEIHTLTSVLLQHCTKCFYYIQIDLVLHKCHLFMSLI